MKKLSIDNGNTFDNDVLYLDSCIKQVGWDAIVNVMDNDIREIVHNRNVVYTHLSFLCAYLRRAKSDLIIG